ncbi:DUF21 domain-containing protein [Nonomuraea sp. FMUSA5-5]|uniref:DUF21 domain-containing protein n=1 Tax=Nonomuraea composti TaxID=2720023 RepID=A0ABX1BE74_9ACTN|nr:DUF21 domain-containing protein [Nonomuraea sp. FMUSA5-5]
MDGYWVQLALVVVLVILNAVFAGSELALISLREGQLWLLERHGAGGRLVVRLARDPNRFLATIQLVITLSGFLASATAAVTLSEPLVPLLGFLGDAAGPVAIVVVTIVLTFLTLVFGELAPKRVAMQRAETWALLMARPPSVIATLSRPVVWALARSTDVAVRLMGGDPAQHREEISPEEIRDVVSVRRAPDGSLLLPGDFPVHDLTDLDIDLEGRPDGDYTTVAGLALTLLGRVPTAAGDRVTAGEWELEIVAVERHAITGIRARPAGAADDAAPAGRRAARLIQVAPAVPGTPCGGVRADGRSLSGTGSRGARRGTSARLRGPKVPVNLTSPQGCSR